MSEIGTNSNIAYDLQKFTLQRVLNDDPLTHTIVLLGTLPHSGSDERRETAIIRVERLGFSPLFATEFPTLVNSTKVVESTDIYSWMLGWTEHLEDSPDIKINVIFPATEVHIRKYSRQNMVMVHETPQLYSELVKPFIDAFPPVRTQWVDNILSGISEASKVLYNDLDTENGFVILPDMKWDGFNVSTLYLVAIARSLRIKSLRDLRKDHLKPLKSIKHEAERVAGERWGIEKGGLRFYVHYQPSYYRFHVHIVNANYVGLMGMGVGHAHLLEDVISLLELSPDEGPTIIERMTLTYDIGEQHGLYECMRRATVENTD